MAGIFGFFSGATEKAPRTVYSLEHLQQLHNRLQHIRDTDEQNRDVMVEVIRQITEALIWGEQRDHNFFDFFCEKNILADFVRVLALPRVPKTVKVQLLQTLSMLVQNIRRETSLYYLFSNNYVNQLIATQFDWSDEEILGYYISFLKSLALRLNRETVKFFFNERSKSFPLYVEAVRFFGHHEQMVRTAIRNLTLQVYRVEDDGMRSLVLQHSSRTYFPHLCCHLRELWARLDQVAKSGISVASPEQVPDALKEANEQQQDVILYVSDVLGLGIPELSEVLTKTILQNAIYPVLMGRLQQGPDALLGYQQPGGRGTPASQMSFSAALFILHQVLDSSKNTILLPPVAEALLSPSLSARVLGPCSSSPPKPPSTYRATTSDVSGPSSNEVVDFSVSSETLAEQEEEGEMKEALIRSQLLSALQGPSDSSALLAAGILQICLAACQSGALSKDLLLGASTNQVLLEVVSALKRHSELRPVVVQALCSLCRDLMAESMAHFANTQQEQSASAQLAEELAAPLDGVRSVRRAAARHVRSFASEDSFVDIFAEEWETSCKTPSSSSTSPSRIKVAHKEASNLRSLLPAVVGMNKQSAVCPREWCFPDPHSERQQASKATQCLLIINRLVQELEDLQRTPSTLSPTKDLDGGASLKHPLAITEEDVSGYMDGKSVELGRQDRIVCGVVTSQGRQTRYLVLHKFLFLLVQPDLTSPGYAEIRTMLPLRCVEPFSERLEPRTLRLRVKLDSGTKMPQEAFPLDPGAGDAAYRISQEDARGSAYCLLTLSFEDVRRCQCAEAHIRNSRQAVRLQVLRNIEAYVEALCDA